MKKACVLMLMCMMGVAAQAVLIDSFDGDLSAYTSTVILDNANPAVQNTAAWQITGGTLQLNTTVRDGTSVEQYAMIRSGLALLVGQEVQVDLRHSGSGATQDLGLYVGGTTPTFNVRQDYVAIYGRNNGQVFSRGFNGTTEYALSGGSSPTYDRLFIARTDVNTYQAGWIYQGVRTVLVTRTPSFANEGDVVGFYADVRSIGVLGNLDNLRTVPEPATMGLMGLGALLFARKRK
jgi:hypothetical protein